jgi:hypothetical protein
VVAVNKRLADIIGASIPEERVQFPLPTADDLADATSAHLLWQAARLTLRDGATPFRSLGRISIGPRIYQFVPLLMALRLDPVRLLIADDVGVGKTIEALLIARELLDRGEIKRLCVLCPPYLCDQRQRELAEKANLEAVVIRSGTMSQLEHRKAEDESRHLILLTATPHSGLEASFRSLLGFVRPEFRGWDMSALLSSPASAPPISASRGGAA